MNFQKNGDRPPSIQKRLMRVILALFFFPFKVRKRYLRYNAVLWEAEQENKATEGRLQDYRKNNIKLLNMFIHTPLALCAVIVLAMIFFEIDGFAQVAHRMSVLPKIVITKPKVTQLNVRKYFKDVRYAAKDINFRYGLLGFGACYGFCFAGAIILSMSPAWKEERSIKDALTSNRCLDLNGDPWKVTWTPDVIIFHTYQCDPDSFVGNSKFWNTINFKPDNPVQFKNDANKIIVARAYALPFIISFEIKPE
jgi:hypothetical protein